MCVSENGHEQAKSVQLKFKRHMGALVDVIEEMGKPFAEDGNNHLELDRRAMLLWMLFGLPRGSAKSSTKSMLQGYRDISPLKTDKERKLSCAYPPSLSVPCGLHLGSKLDLLRCLKNSISSAPDSASGDSAPDSEVQSRWVSSHQQAETRCSKNLQ